MNIIICDDLYIQHACYMRYQHACYSNTRTTRTLHALPTCMLLNTRTTCMVHALPFPTPVQHACNTHVTGVLHAC